MKATKNMFVKDETGETVPAWDDTKRYASDNVAATMQSLWDQFGLLVDALNQIDDMCDETEDLQDAWDDAWQHIKRIAHKASLDNPTTKDLRIRLASYGVNL